MIERRRPQWSRNDEDIFNKKVPSFCMRPRDANRSLSKRCGQGGFPHLAESQRAKRASFNVHREEKRRKRNRKP